jgi:hypothetical protein
MVHLSAVAALCRQDCSTVSAPALDRFQPLVLPPTRRWQHVIGIQVVLCPIVSPISRRPAFEANWRCRSADWGSRRRDQPGPGCHRCNTIGIFVAIVFGDNRRRAPASAGVGYTGETQQSYLEAREYGFCIARNVRSPCRLIY